LNNPDPEKMNEITSKIPLGRFGSPTEVAKVVIFLSSEDSSYINGTDILVDGGASAIDALRT